MPREKYMTAVRSSPFFKIVGARIYIAGAVMDGDYGGAPPAVNRQTREYHQLNKNPGRPRLFLHVYGLHHRRSEASKPGIVGNVTFMTLSDPDDEEKTNEHICGVCV